jgi:ring-1,2-phenylacetyl-CoA epoxidase subunit PaaD
MVTRSSPPASSSPDRVGLPPTPGPTGPEGQRHLPDAAAVRAAVAGVADPELPPVTLGMLGVVHDVDVDDTGRVEVELLPTFSGCPATEMMDRDVVAAVSRIDGVREVEVRFRFSPPWSATMISDEGHQRLREFGIAPPGGEVPSVRPEGRRALPLLLDDPPDPPARPCPYCASTDTVRESAFGPTPCRDLRFCQRCQQPFEAFKDL